MKKIIFIVLALFAVNSNAQNIIVLGQSNAYRMYQNAYWTANYFNESVGGTNANQHLIGGTINQNFETWVSAAFTPTQLLNPVATKIIINQGEQEVLYGGLDNWTAKWISIVSYYRYRYCTTTCKIVVALTSNTHGLAGSSGVANLRSQQQALANYFNAYTIEMNNYQFIDGLHLTVPGYQQLALDVIAK